MDAKRERDGVQAVFRRQKAGNSEFATSSSSGNAADDAAVAADRADGFEQSGSESNGAAESACAAECASSESNAASLPVSIQPADRASAARTRRRAAHYDAADWRADFPTGNGRTAAAHSCQWRAS